MKSCRAMRNVSRGGLARGGMMPVRGLGPTGLLARDAPRRGMCLMRFARGVHDGIRGVFELGEWVVGGQYSPLARNLAAASSSRSSIRHGTSIKRFNTSTAAPSWSLSPSSPPTVDPNTETTLPEKIRSVMRLVPHSVVVCTSTHDKTPRAMTMSSFTSLTLSPTPLISFNVATPSRTLDAIEGSDHFNIHILAGSPDGAAVSDHFTRGNAGHDVFQGLDVVFDSTTVDGAPAAPVIQGEGVLHVLRCRLLRDTPQKGVLRVRDHVIVVGEVVEMIPGKSQAREFGLGYVDRRYRQVGGVITKGE